MKVFSQLQSAYGFGAVGLQRGSVASSCTTLSQEAIHMTEIESLKCWAILQRAGCAGIEIGVWIEAATVGHQM
jgi:hypothetical protein